MDRSELNDRQKQDLTSLVSALFAGATFEFETDDGPSKFLCFRMRDEELPVVPLLENPEDLFAAVESGLFSTGDVYSGAYRAGAQPTARRWMGNGPLCEIMATLESLGAVDQILKNSALQLGFRNALKVPCDRGVVRISASCDPIESNIERPRSA